jgi:hypothetical protein
MSQIVEEWAARLASVATPDEIDVAPYQARAFVEGGEAWASVLRPPHERVGAAFAAGDMVSAFPLVLMAVANASSFAVLVLGNKNVGSCLSLIKNALTLADLRRTKEDVTTSASPDVAQVKNLIDRIGATLRASGLSEDNADLMTYRIVRAMLEDPDGATTFLKSLSSGR